MPVMKYIVNTDHCKEVLARVQTVNHHNNTIDCTSFSKKGVVQ